jgi:glycosyltransferase involved in cell wall biosynthesis
MKLIRVAIYSGEIPSTTFIERLIDGLAQQGLKVILFGRVKQSVNYTSPNIRLVGNHTGARGLLESLIRFIRLRITAPARYNQLKKHIGAEPLSGFTAFRKWQLYAPVVLNLPDVFHVQWAKSVSDWIFLKEKFGVKLVLSLRGTHINISPLANAALAVSYRNSFKQYDAFHGVSNAIVKEAVKYGIDENKARVIYSGLPYRPLPVESRTLSDTLRILAVGRFHWIKGYHYLLDALAILKARHIHFELSLIAQGEMPEEIVYQLHDLNLATDVFWIKGLPYQEVEAQMLMHDVLVLPSVEEGIANVVLEAMQMGLPVVSTNCGGMDEVISHGKNGYLIPVRKPEAIAEAILSVKELSPDGRQGLRQLAHETILQKFDREKNILQFVAMYNNTFSGA